jgi:hypothetical protein
MAVILGWVRFFWHRLAQIRSVGFNKHWRRNYCALTRLFFFGISPGLSLQDHTTSLPALQLCNKRNFRMNAPKLTNLRLNTTILRLAFISVIAAVIVMGLHFNSQAAPPIAVHAGDDLQAKINAAQPGDTLVLDAGATFTGPFTLPNKNGSGTITIKSSRASELNENFRVSPSQSSLFAKLVAPGSGSGDPAIKTAAAAHDYTLIGIEFAPQNANAVVDTLVVLGSGDVDQNTLKRAQEHHHRPLLCARFSQ